jgi:tRNA(Leu) C34 or U34 (ribose-2'-O)-methylase TrmL
VRGFAAIGLVRPKVPENVGSVLRAAHCYGAALVAIQGDRTPVQSITDTPKTWRHLPVLRGDDLHALIPYDAVPVAIDLVDDAESLVTFRHPQRAFYVFGPEDGTLGKTTLEWCARRVYVPTRDCMNLAATVNVVLYDRLAKQSVRTVSDATDRNGAGRSRLLHLQPGGEVGPDDLQGHAAQPPFHRVAEKV